MDSEEGLPHFNVDVYPRCTGFTPERDIDKSRVKDANCKLLTALNRLQSTGSFASGGVLPFLDPEIYLQDVGTIPLPLKRTQGRQLISKAHPATYDTKLWLGGLCRVVLRSRGSGPGHQGTDCSDTAQDADIRHKRNVQAS